MSVTCVVMLFFLSVCSELAGNKPAGRSVKNQLGVIQMKNGGCLDLDSDSRT